MDTYQYTDFYETDKIYMNAFLRVRAIANALTSSKNKEKRQLAQKCFSIAKQIEDIRQDRHLDQIGADSKYYTKTYLALLPKLSILCDSTENTIMEDLCGFDKLIFKAKLQCIPVPNTTPLPSSTKEQELSR